MSSKNVVIVESPAKAKTINKYLGSDYTVLASYGHVRDLPPKDGSVDTENGFEMKWEVGADSRKHVKAIDEECAAVDAHLAVAHPQRNVAVFPPWSVVVRLGRTGSPEDNDAWPAVNGRHVERPGGG